MEKSKMRGGGYRILYAVLILLCTSLFPAHAYAHENVLAKTTDGSEIILYVPEAGEHYELQCQIGSEAVEQIQSSLLRDEASSIETIILWDNSLSIEERYRPVIQEILSDLVRKRMDGERYSIITFDESMHVQVDKSTDDAELQNAIDSMSYNYQNTYLTDILYELLKNIQDSEEKTFRKILIISDGMDNKTLGYSSEELHELIKSGPYPIFTLGCPVEGNEQDLERLFAISRMTGAATWNLDDIAELSSVGDALLKMSRVMRVSILPKAKDLDGSRKGILLTVYEGEGQSTYSTEMSMPFGSIATKQKEQAHSGGDASPLYYISMGLGGFFAIVLLILIIFLLGKKKERKNRFVAADEPAESRQAQMPKEAPQETQFVSPLGSISSGTEFIWGDEGKILILEDVADSRHRFEARIDGRVAIGRERSNTIVLDYDKTVARNQCVIYAQGDMVFVENLSQTNITQLDGSPVKQATVIKSGSLLKMGRITMRAELRA